MGLNEFYTIMNTYNSDNYKGELEETAIKSNLTRKVATAALFITIGAVLLSPFNPFIFIQILSAKIYPIAHVINAIAGVLIGIQFALVTGLGIAIYRFSLGFGSFHAFHGHLSGALIVGITAYVLWKKKPTYVIYSALTEPIGTIFIGGTIAYLVNPIIYATTTYDLVFLWGFWASWALSSIPGAIIGFLILIALSKAGISREDYFNL
ncbi:MAG: energy coupling factor transporter S component ThiW [Candidatus Hermodarchaeota archaeon]